MAMELESSIFSQEEAVREATDLLYSKKPLRKEPQKPLKPYIEFPKYDPPPAYENFRGRRAVVHFIIGLIVLSVVSCGMSFDHDSIFSLPLPIIMLLCTPLFLGVYALIKGKSEEREVNELRDRYISRYNVEKNKLLEKEKEENKIFEDKMALYKKECNKADEHYQHQMIVFQQAKKAIGKLDVPIREMKETLESLYSVDVIYPKYRNFVAICTFYEYFLSGRCEKLAGPNGAYNLYESELRQNIIINRLDNIINQLSQIEDNQYALFMELQEAKKLSESICSDVNSILSETISISSASHITSACAKATEENMTVLKYISILNSLNK